jgi:hypothetical protein
MIKNNITLIVATWLLLASSFGIDKSYTKRLFEEGEFYCYEINFDDFSKKRISTNQVPEKYRKDAIFWIKNIINQKWLPLDVEANLIAYKDVLFDERRDSNGVVFSKWEEDILSLKYQINNFSFRVNESGDVITIKISYPKKLDLSKNADAFIQEELRKYLNLPKDWTPNFSIKKQDLLFRSKFVKIDFNEAQWWEGIKIFSDENFLFVVVPKLNGKGIRRYSKPGLPNRF